MRRALIAIPIVIAVLAVALAYYFLDQQTHSSQVGPYGPPSSEATTVKFKTASFTDSQGIGTKAFNMLIPSNWQAEGTIRWVLDNPAMPAYGDFRDWNPNGTEEFHFFENQAFFSSDNPMILQTFPPGSRYFGAMIHDPLVR